MKTCRVRLTHPVVHAIADLARFALRLARNLGALGLIRRAGARSVVSCDTVEHPTNRIECAPLVGAAPGSAR